MNSNGGRPVVSKPRNGGARMKVLVDEPGVGAVGRTAAAPGSSKDAAPTSKGVPRDQRTALNELANPNRLKVIGGPGKENKGSSIPVPTVSAPTASTTASTRPRSGSVAASAPTAVQTRVIVHRSNGPATASAATNPLKAASSRHTQRESSAASAAVFRPGTSRHRDEDDGPAPDAGSRKRIRILPGGVARPAPSFAVGNALAEDHMDIEDGTPVETLDGEDYDGAEAKNEEEDDEETVTLQSNTAISPSPEPEPAVLDWTMASPETEARYEDQIQTIRASFKDEVDEWDMTMVSEYSEEIFEYMGKLEVQSMADPDYMDAQTEIVWHMRFTLVDWLVQIHNRYHLLPETLWIAINVIDRFLSKRVVSLVKLQLVGITAMFIASKYEEIMAPSVEEFVFMTEGGYTKDEILKGERIILQSLGFHISQYCSPYSWVRRISKADDYDIQTRTLSKFLMEVCLLDHRFLRAKPSMIAAVGMYTARRMLEGDWGDAFVFYSNFTGAQLEPGFEFLVETIAQDGFEQTHTYRKYTSKKFLKASTFAREWARTNYVPPPPEEDYESEDIEEDYNVTAKLGGRRAHRHEDMKIETGA